MIEPNSVKQNKHEIIFNISSEYLNDKNYTIEIFSDCIEISINKTKSSDLNETIYLFDKINVEKSKYEYCENKIIFTLYKNTPKLWESLCKNTSNKWNVTEKHADLLDDKEATVSLDKFFKLLYKNCSDESRQSMVRSFVESNGTELSTNSNNK